MGNGVWGRMQSQIAKKRENETGAVGINAIGKNSGSQGALGC